MKQLTPQELEEFWELPKGIMRPWTDIDGNAEDFEYTALRNMFRYDYRREPNEQEAADLRVQAAARVQEKRYGKDINQMEVIYEEVRPDPQ